MSFTRYVGLCKRYVEKKQSFGRRGPVVILPFVKKNCFAVCFKLVLAKCQ